MLLKRALIQYLILCLSAVPCFSQVKVLGLKGRVVFDKASIHAGQQLVGPGTLIAAGAGSYVDIELPGGHVTRLRNGTLVLKKVEEKATLMSLLKGQAFSMIKKLKGRSTYQMETTGAVAGVRGTKLFFEENGKQSYVCVCEGRIDLKKKGAPENKRGRLIPSGKEVFTPAGGEPGKTQPAAKDKLAQAKEEFKDLGF